MSNTFKIAEVVVSGAIATDGTVTFAYPSGVSSTTAKSTGASAWIEGLQAMLTQGSTTFTLAYSTDITFTWKGTTSIPAGSKISLQIPVLDNTVDGILDKQAHITDASTAHALNSTFSDTEAEAALNALGTKINAILVVLEKAGLVADS